MGENPEPISSFKNGNTKEPTLIPDLMKTKSSDAKDENGSGRCPDVFEIASRLLLESKLDSFEQAYVLYCEYERMLGFSVKKGTRSSFRKTAMVRMKLHHCSCEGHTDNRASDMKIATYKKQHTRCDCKARLRLTHEIDGPWAVSMFHEEHNHELLGVDEIYLLRSSCNLTHAKRSILETFNSTGIGVSRACRLLEKESGGPQNLGFTRKNAYDHISRIRRVGKLDNNVADALLHYFQGKSACEPYLFWKVHLDDEGRLMNYFFRDCRSADDYDKFGDVISVDITF